MIASVKQGDLLMHMFTEVICTAADVEGLPEPKAVTIFQMYC